MPIYPKLTDIELLALLKVNDCKAFEEIYNRYWKKLLSVATHKAGNTEEAEEIVNDIFVSLWKRREEIELFSTLNNYLAVAVKYQVLKIRARRHLQEKHKITTTTPELYLSDNSTQEWLDFNDLKLQLSKMVINLPEKCRLVYQLSRDKGLSQKQIAAELGISTKTVEAHIGKALKVLKTNLQQFLFSFFL